MYMQSGARISKLLSERVLGAHWKGVVTHWKGVVLIFLTFPSHSAVILRGILCHAELQIAINPTYSNLITYLDSIISITIIFVDASENGG